MYSVHIATKNTFHKLMLSQALRPTDHLREPLHHMNINYNQIAANNLFAGLNGALYRQPEHPPDIPLGAREADIWIKREALRSRDITLVVWLLRNFFADQLNPLMLT